MLFLLAGLSIDVTEGPAMTLPRLLERCTAAMGDGERLSAVRSIWRQRNRHTFTLRKKPDHHLVLLLDDEGKVRYAEGFDGEAAWEQVGEGPKVAVGARARIALWHTTQFPSVLDPLASLPKLGHELELAGEETVEGTPYHRVLLRLSDGFERMYYVNAGTYRLERSRDVRRHHTYEEQAQPIESVWSDFRKVEGLWLPFTTAERNHETGERLSGGTMRQIRLDVDVPDEVFRLEGSIEPFLELVRRLGVDVPGAASP